MCDIPLSKMYVCVCWCMRITFVILQHNEYEILSCHFPPCCCCCCRCCSSSVHFFSPATDNFIRFLHTASLLKCKCTKYLLGLFGSMHSTYKEYKVYNGFRCVYVYIRMLAQRLYLLKHTQQELYTKRKKKSYIVIFCSLLFEFRTRVEAWG